MSATKTENQNTAIRPPIICILGHIDHGKSTLLDYIRKTKVTENEVGGITQAISAYEVEQTTEGGKTRTLTFLDTPGHEAFQKMRLRGTRVADIAVLVVSAEDGVKPQTLEAYEAIKSAKTPFVVAITKIDKPNANIERVKNTLAEAGIYLEGYGGDISYVPVSSVTGQGVKELLDILVLTADIGDFKCDMKRPGEGYVIETTRDPRRGIYATLIIKNGSLSVGDTVVSGTSWSPVRMLENFLGKKIKTASCGTAVGLSGWTNPPNVGDMFKTVDSKKEAAKEVLLAKTNMKDKKNTKETASEKKVIALLIKGDMLGSIEAVIHEINKISHERVSLKVINSGVGDISESDVKSVNGLPNTIVVGFNVKIDAQAKALADRFGVTVETFNIIYKLAEWLEKFIKDNAPRIEVEEVVGKAKIMRFFSKTKDKQIIGGKVIEGEIKVGHRVKIKRRDVEIGMGIIKELQQQKEKTSSVLEGFEFGTMVEAKMEIAPGDILEDFVVVEKQ